MGPYELGEEKNSANYRIHPIQRPTMQYATRLVACSALVLQLSRKQTYKRLLPKQNPSS